MQYIFLLLIHLFPTSEQNSRVFELFDTESGLSNNIVYDIHQDREGFIWIATDNGLNRYDGYHFKQFYHSSKDRTSLSSNIVRRIIEDKEGNLWIGTKNGFNLYDRKNENFQQYSIKKNTKLPILYVRQVALDNDGKIWFSNLKEFGYFDTHTREFTIVESDFDAYSITMQADSVLWIGSKEVELRFIEKRSLEYTKIPKYKSLENQQIHYGKYTNSLWLPKGSLHESLDVSLKIIPELPGNITPFRLTEIDGQTLLIGSNDGLYEYNNVLKTTKKVHLSNSFSTLTKQIRSIYKDRNGGIWVGTLGGVFYYDDYKNNFEHFDLNEKEVDVVMGLQRTSDGVYVNTLGKGLYYKSHAENDFKKLRTEKSITEEELFVWGIKEVPESNYPIWMSTNTGLLCYNPQNEKIRKISLPVINAGEEMSFDAYNTKHNYVWVASMGSIHKVDKSSGKLLETYFMNDGKSTSIVQKIIEFNDQLIFATESEGMYLLNKDTRETSLIRLKEGAEEKENIFTTSIWDLHVFQNTLWIGTSRGLFTLEQGNNSAALAFNNNQIIFSIEDDDNDVLWLGTEKGLISYEIATKKIHRYGKVDGLRNVEFNRRSVTKTNDGKLWFGGIHGITVFDPSDIHANPIKPEVYITKLDVITADSTFRTQHQREKVVLPHYQNTIEIDYVALNYTNPSQNRYKHQMIGHDPKWVRSQSRKARYTQLPAGSYTFQVIASNNDGLWNEVGDQIEIEVLPPYWETWWFRSIILLALAGLTFLLYKYRVKKLLEMERMKLRIAGDLHDDVGSGLSGIALTSDILEQQVNQGEVKPHLISRITRNARNLASTLDDIVWLINPEKEKLKDLIIKTKTVAQELLHNVDVSFEEELQESMRNKILSSEFKRNLLLFLKEVIHNIAKHAEAEKVHILYKTTEKKLLLEIKDSGKGFEPDEETSGNGLISLRNRAKQMNGRLEINSKKSLGTTIILIAKIP